MRERGDGRSCERAFRPEFLNRVDEIILFHRLKRDRDGRDRRHPAGAAAESCSADRKIELELDEHARDWLAEKGYDPAYGARPLKRVIQKEVQDPLAEKILGGEILDGSTVNVSGRLRPAAVPAATDSRRIEQGRLTADRTMNEPKAGCQMRPAFAFVAGRVA